MIGSLQPSSIHLRNCKKTYRDGTVAVEAMDFDIAAGETVVILGPSGCGKTTTLRMIAGLEAPDAGGCILFDDHDVTNLPIEQRNVGMVFQRYALFPNFNVLDNIAYGLRVRGVSKDIRRKRALELMEMMRLEAFAHRQINQLSGGQKQRVALARALAIEPHAMLLDEALTALDAKLRDILRTEIDSLLHRLGITTIYVTHDQEEAMQLGDRIVVMDHGEVVQIGTPQEVYRQPANRFVAEFVGTMNRLSGEMLNGKFVCTNGKLASNHLKPGCKEVMFRPESVSLCNKAESDLAGRVMATFFLGDRTRLFVEGAGDKPIIVETNEMNDIRVEQKVYLKVRPEAVFEI